jgi:hypothetical protein
LKRKGKIRVIRKAALLLFNTVKKKSWIDVEWVWSKDWKGLKEGR